MMPPTLVGCRRWAAVLVCGLGVAPGPTTAAEPTPAEQAAIDTARAAYAGTWRLVAVESNGESQLQQDGREILVVNRLDGSWSIMVDGLETSGGQSRMDPLADPPEIDIEFTSGEGKGRMLLAIYELVDRRRRLCFRGAEGWRPREFRTVVGDGAVLLTFEKRKPADDMP